MIYLRVSIDTSNIPNIAISENREGRSRRAVIKVEIYRLVTMTMGFSEVTVASQG